MTNEKSVSVSCCKESDSLIEWRQADSSAHLRPYMGPEQTGWCIATSADCCGNLCGYVNISYCPFCGNKLPEVGGEN